eukprot:CAMPEP_0195580678 /NCGR_PEP_ID=MMETSP0814-20130614/18507_1 /TAXON_ID=97485 /ORGANISM="Prymnesium parvum, Strain Texoma1" /LENGTH=55 /DNA_ID=CAMNT_0040717857 /DNA_START=369 /DNA_END=533 /DNA_ORIENTATION=-
MTSLTESPDLFDDGCHSARTEPCRFSSCCLCIERSVRAQHTMARPGVYAAEVSAE